MFPLSNLLSRSIKKGTLVVIDADGNRHEFGDGTEPKATMHLHDKKLYRTLVTDTELAGGEGYMNGSITFEEGSTVRDLLVVYSVNQNRMPPTGLQKTLGSISRQIRRVQQSNRLGEAQKNVSHHYDIGNEFYKLFLDRNLLYSCAYFESEKDTLEEAQINKLRLLASKLNVKKGQKILDIGSGWGQLGLYLAQVEDVDVTGVTLSREQYELSNAKAQKMGLSDRVRFKLLDYRELEGQFDRIVSVGMFEHVGVHHYDEFFSKINALMPDEGLTVLHSIGHMSPPSVASPWLRKYIFPGAYSPALSEVFEVVEPNRLWVLDVEILRVHYAMTIRHWSDRFQANRAEVVKMFDERFARMWEFYLISVEQMFRTGAQMVFQMQLSRRRDVVPLQRDYIHSNYTKYKKLEKKKGFNTDWT